MILSEAIASDSSWWGAYTKAHVHAVEQSSRDVAVSYS
jgi:hypothetical protein